ncbi:hypothetical protein SNEBB_006584 [Seison nebaliae]|nr:hypothetical protein SNEBB_006584 [Seison nebaliae]
MLSSSCRQIFFFFFLALFIADTYGYTAGKNKISFNLLKKWLRNKQIEEKNNLEAVKRQLVAPDSKHHVLTEADNQGCSDPSEPFLCKGSGKCISLAFLCDKKPNDCPDNSDEDEQTCTAANRPARPLMQEFLGKQLKKWGNEFFVDLFGENVANKVAADAKNAITEIAFQLSVTKNINQFVKKMGMTKEEALTFQNILEAIYLGEIDDIPVAVANATPHGLTSLVTQLLKTDFCNPPIKE